MDWRLILGGWAAVRGPKAAIANTGGTITFSADVDDGDYASTLSAACPVHQFDERSERTAAAGRIALFCAVFAA